MEIEEYSFQRRTLIKQRDETQKIIKELDEEAEATFGISENGVLTMDGLIKAITYLKRLK